MTEIPATDLETTAREGTVAGPTDSDLSGDHQQTLPDYETDCRLACVARNLRPHLADIEEYPDGYSSLFDRTAGTSTAVAECPEGIAVLSAATFQMELPPGDGPKQWHEHSDSETATELNRTFGEAFQHIQVAIEDLPGPEATGVVSQVLGCGPTLPVAPAGAVPQP